jgi:hypothetical protein
MLLIYSTRLTSRLEYIVQALMDALGVKHRITDDITEFSDYEGARINYSVDPVNLNSLHIAPGDLLFSNEIIKQQIECFEWEGQKAFYHNGPSDVPFDIFAASFYLVSRYEEYLPHQLDSYGRYGHENSLAFREGFLHLPLVNLWLQEFKKILQQRFPELQFRSRMFSFIPTYDVDIAWSYLGKGILRNVVGSLRSITKNEGSSLKERISVLQGNQKDPFDIYEWLDDLHQQHKLKPLYFFLLANQQKGYDKNIHPSNKNLQTLIADHSSKYEVGIHPSWQSGDDVTLLEKEIRHLRIITGKEVVSSRQHYIRMKLPDTYRQSLSAGIEKDYSMGYGSINGFRASYCLPYKWYDLKKESVTNLTLYPFCYMEANSHFEQHFTLEQATEELESYHTITREVNGLFITIMHNHLLGDNVLFNGWKEMYENFLQKHFGTNA